VAELLRADAPPVLDIGLPATGAVSLCASAMGITVTLATRLIRDRPLVSVAASVAGSAALRGGNYATWRVPSPAWHRAELAARRRSRDPMSQIEAMHALNEPSKSAPRCHVSDACTLARRYGRRRSGLAAAASTCARNAPSSIGRHANRHDVWHRTHSGDSAPRCRWRWTDEYC